MRLGVVVVPSSDGISKGQGRRWFSPWVNHKAVSAFRPPVLVSGEALARIAVLEE